MRCPAERTHDLAARQRRLVTVLAEGRTALRDRSLKGGRDLDNLYARWRQMARMSTTGSSDRIGCVRDERGK